MPDLEFLPAWYPRMLRRRRWLTVSVIAGAVAAIVAVLTLSL